MRLAYNLILLSFAVQSFAYLAWTFNILAPFNAGLTTQAPSIFGIFNLPDIATGIVGVGAIAIGIGAIITRSGTYALYALLVFGIGLFVTQVQQFFLAIPNLINNMGVNWPTFPGSSITVVTPFIVTFAGLMVFAWGWFLQELITQGGARV